MAKLFADIAKPIIITEAEAVKLVDAIAAAMTIFGYKLTTTKDINLSYKLSNQKLGVKIFINYYNNSMKMYLSIYVRRKNGRYRLVNSLERGLVFGVNSKRQIELIVEQLKTLKGTTVEKPENQIRPTPYRFTNLVLRNQSGNIICDHLYRTCSVREIVAVVGTKITKSCLASPHEDQWFLVKGETAIQDSGAHPQLIVQEQHGEWVYHIVFGRTIVCPGYKNLAYRSDTLSHITKLDEQMITLAIKHYLEKLV